MDTVPAPIPSVFDLGRHLVTLWERLDDHDGRVLESGEQSVARRQAESDHDATNDEIDAVEALVFARPVTTLADGAALAAVAFRQADFLTAIEPDGERYLADVERLRNAFARLNLLLTDAAGLPPIVLAGSDYNAAYIARHASTGVASP